MVAGDELATLLNEVAAKMDSLARGLESGNTSPNYVASQLREQAKRIRDAS